MGALSLCTFAIVGTYYDSVLTSVLRATSAHMNTNAGGIERKNLCKLELTKYCFKSCFIKIDRKVCGKYAYLGIKIHHNLLTADKNKGAHLLCGAFESGVRRASFALR